MLYYFETSTDVSSAVWTDIKRSGVKVTGFKVTEVRWSRSQG